MLQLKKIVQVKVITSALGCPPLVLSDQVTKTSKTGPIVRVAIKEMFKLQSATIVEVAVTDPGLQKKE